MDMAMDNELINLFRSLISVTKEETQLLASGQRSDIPDLVQAKARLMGALDAEVARLDRVSPDWCEELHTATRSELAELAATLRETSRANGEALKRQIDLSNELMAEIAANLRRRHGSGGGYGADGSIVSSGNVPLSVNASI